MVGHKDFLGACHTRVRADVFRPPEVSSERTFVAQAMRNEVLEWGKSLFHSFISCSHVAGPPGLEGGQRRPSSEST